jgi:hypothetical protein
MLKTTHLLFISFCLLIMIFFMACNKNSNSQKSNTLDYSNKSNWLALAETRSHDVDVFYVYPTIYAESSPPNMDIERFDLRERAKIPLKTQASVFTEQANIYAPFYRQASMSAATIGDYDDLVFLRGANDIINAFDYYIEKINNNRPFILAGHSQGSQALIHLMRERFNDINLQKRLVAAYLIGFSVTQTDLQNYPWFKIAQSSNDLGVIITYNTQTKDIKSSPLLLDGAIAVNPLSWSTKENYADSSANLGARFYNPSSGELIREVPNYLGARIDKTTGALIVNPSETLDCAPFPNGILHRYDYMFWYKNLEANVSERIDAYLNQK